MEQANVQASGSSSQNTSSSTRQASPGMSATGGGPRGAERGRASAARPARRGCGARPSMRDYSSSRWGPRSDTPAAKVVAPRGGQRGSQPYAARGVRRRPHARGSPRPADLVGLSDVSVGARPAGSGLPRTVPHLASLASHTSSVDGVAVEAAARLASAAVALAQRLARGRDRVPVVVRVGARGYRRATAVALLAAFTNARSSGENTLTRTRRAGRVTAAGVAGSPAPVAPTRPSSASISDGRPSASSTRPARRLIAPCRTSASAARLGGQRGRGRRGPRHVGLALAIVAHDDGEAGRRANVGPCSCGSRAQPEVAQRHGWALGDAHRHQKVEVLVPPVGIG